MDTPETQAEESRYVIAVIGPGAAGYGPTLERTIRRRLTELGDDLEHIVEFRNAVQTPERLPKVPVVGVYFGGDATSDSDLQAVRSLLNVSAVVIPVVEDIDNYQGLVPEEIWPVNGMPIAADDTDLDEIANLVLENLGLLRRTRRLFISYRRNDSSQEAVQLQHTLGDRGYDVFLDTRSVPRGDDFQAVLWQRLADSDVVVLLNTKDFMASRWTTEELAQASAMTIGLIQIIWPGENPVNYSELCEPFYLEPTDFEDSAEGGLTADTLVRIALAVEQLRARSLAARHNNLVREFCDAAATANVDAYVQPMRFITAEVNSGPLIAIPAVGVPDALRYHEASRHMTDAGETPPTVLLIYDQRGLRQNWCGFLDWLDDFLPVKAVKITNVRKRLESL